MLIDVRQLHDGQPVAILGLGHTVLPEAFRYDNRRFVLEFLSQQGQEGLRQDLGLTTEDGDEELARLADEKFVKHTGIRSRYIFPGSIAELGSIAAAACLRDANVSVDEIDAIIVGTNTSDSYSVATEIKRLIGAPIRASVVDEQVACPTGVVIVRNGWMHVRSRAHRRVLLVGIDQATRLPRTADDYRKVNLFGDAAFAMLLGPGEYDDFVFFDDGSDPTGGKDRYIYKDANGFQQDGPTVHEYVAKEVPKVFEQTFTDLNLDPATIDHFFPHQPSVRTINLFLRAMRKRFPSFRATVHGNVEEMGNTSAACTGWMASRAKAEGLLQPGQLCLVASFGGGMSWGFYAFTFSKRSDN